MFAHQVIEDLEEMLENVKGSLNGPYAESVYERLEASVPSIRTSHKFHMGNANELADIVRMAQGRELFLQPQYIKLPYPNCWFDYTVTMDRFIAPDKFRNTKEAMHVTTIKNNIFLAQTYTYVAESGKWIPNLLAFVIVPGGPLYGDNRAVMNELCPNLNLKDTGGAIIPTDVGDLMPREERDAILRESSLDLSLLERSLMLLNCKNIRIEKISAPERLNKKRRQSGKQPLFDYRVLNVLVPSKKQGYREGTIPVSHDRVHICRGHFKEYTSEHPLMGKHVGLFWWQPHVRGQNKEGIVTKDYKITMVPRASVH